SATRDDPGDPREQGRRTGRAALGRRAGGGPGVGERDRDPRGGGDGVEPGTLRDRARGRPAGGAAQPGEADRDPGYRGPGNRALGSRSPKTEDRAGDREADQHDPLVSDRDDLPKR